MEMKEIMRILAQEEQETELWSKRYELLKFYGQTGHFRGGCRGIFGIYSVWRALVRKDRGICGNWTIYRGLNEVLSGLGQFCN
jgi:hypothetical protein